MNKNRLKKLAAVCVALAGAGVFAFGGCAKHGDSHTHTWTDYRQDGADGHYRLSTCLDHATVREDNPHDGDTCSKCGYVKQSGDDVPVTGVQISGKTSVKVGDSIQLTATLTPANATAQVVWTITAGSQFAEIDQDGLLTGTAKGSVTVKATAGGVSTTHTVQVAESGAETGKDPSTPSDPLVTPDNPVISNPAQGVTITKASAGELEAAYVEWTAADGAEWYNVYVSPEGENDWEKLDAPLVRQYKNYYRADAVGLAAGSYDMKVVPADGNGTEMAQQSATAGKITVFAHERAGYGFYGGSASGAYNDDGTLREGAKVIYVTAETAKTVTATVTKGKVTDDYTGFQAILKARENSQDKTPLCFRIVGKVSIDDTDKLESSAEGLQIKGTEGITIEGVGNDATIFGFGMLIRACDNVEVRNLGILNCLDDGVSIDTDNTHLWIHNNDIFYGKKGSGDKAKGDGALDTKLSSLITHSYNHFWDCGKCNLQGMKGEKTDNRITYHHNWYDHSDSRHPRIRTCTVHIYNNYFDGNAKYGVGVTMGASAFVENNYFRSTAAMRPMMSSGQGTDAQGDGTFTGEDGGMIKAYGNTYDCPASNLKLLTQKNTTADNIDCYEAATRDEIVPATYKTKAGGTTYNNFDTADDMYEYTVDTAEQARVKVMRYAGRVDGGDFKWTFDNSTEDSNYGIISGLSSAILAYEGKVIKIGKED